MWRLRRFTEIIRVYRMDTMTETKVSWVEPSGRQWGHPFHPLVELTKRFRLFSTRKEAEIFAAGLKIGKVRDIHVHESWEK